MVKATGTGSEWFMNGWGLIVASARSTRIGLPPDRDRREVRMIVLLLGVGMQGKAAMHDLVHGEAVSEIIAADRDYDQLQAHVVAEGFGGKVRCERVDAASPESLAGLMSQGPDVAIDLMPVLYHNNVAAAALSHRVHLVNASYPTPEMKELSGECRAQDITILPEFGMDPGIDLVLLGEAVRSLDSVDEIVTYGAGFPEPKAVDNPLKYKVTWTFDGVLRSYRRAGRVIRDGKIVDFQDTDMFSPEHLHEIELEGLGQLEAFPNGDAIKYATVLGIETGQLKNLGRYVLRWPGHCALWKTLVELRFLDDEPVFVNGLAVDRRQFLTALLEPQIQYNEDERDVVVVRIDVKGRKGGEATRALFQVIDWRDLVTGFTAMSRTVGYTASIGAQMIGSGAITKRGLLSPVNDVPYEAFVHELGKRDIRVTSEIGEYQKI
jgi:lysine 6-dehydrogenase